MNLLVVGVSHRTAPVGVLERVAVSGPALPEVLTRLLAQEYVREAVLLSTCNRVEVYAVVAGFHGGLNDVVAVLGAHSGLVPAELAAHAYVHYEADAVRHAYRVAAGLDSMVVGESQVLGQLREAYQLAIEREAVGRLLHELMQQALRVGKRAHAETGIDRAGQSVVTAALDVAATHLASASRSEHRASASRSEHRASASRSEHRASALLIGRPAMVVGAGAMGALALSALQRRGAGPLTIANRSPQRAARLAGAYGATVTPLADLGARLSRVDVAVFAAATGDGVLSRDSAAAALALRSDRAGPLVILDLAIPRNVDPEAADLPGVVLIDIEQLGARLSERPAAGDLAAADHIVAVEVEVFLTWLRGTDVAPAVAALRARADEVVTVELRRLAQRRPDLTEEQRREIANTVRRVVQRLLHSPTVRVRELAAGPDGDRYAALLSELFDLELPREVRIEDVPDLGEARL
ncbi:MAG TPA: glutamyl-tRNA reductase [Pseudonocardiaceae bacterium]|nr:glutamyl-tRNA reductase [Pseudonocardiaceae bacterium]